MNNVKNMLVSNILSLVKDKINGELIYLTQYGSHLYGLNTENIDFDFRVVYITNLDDIILKKDKDEINEELYITTNLQHTDNEYLIIDSVDKVKVDVKIAPPAPLVA